jgi:hypothetical protein
MMIGVSSRSRMRWQLDAVDGREVEVEDDQVHPLPLDDAQGVVTVECAGDLEPLVAQPELHEVEGDLVVVHDQDARWCGGGYGRLGCHASSIPTAFWRPGRVS